jgi:hypothetical protein
MRTVHIGDKPPLRKVLTDEFEGGTLPVALDAAESIFMKRRELGRLGGNNMQMIRTSLPWPAKKDLRQVTLAGVFGAGLSFYIAQAMVASPTAWAENSQGAAACSLEVKPEFIPLSEISPYFIDAIVAAEDPNFYNHTPEQTARVYAYFKSIADVAKSNMPAIPNNPTPEEKARAYKAIEEAVMNNPMPPKTDMDIISSHLAVCVDTNLPKAAIPRKIEVAAWVLRIERELPKNTILLLYVNQAYLGRGKWGVSAASQAYFGKRAKDLALAEAAFLAGLPKEPAKFSILPIQGLKRRNEVLDAMVQAGKITPAQAEAAKAEPLDLKPPRTNP